MTVDVSKIPDSLVEAFDIAVAAAQHLDERHLGAIVNARKLARKIDAWDRIVEWALDDVEEDGAGRPRVPQNDNVSPSAFAKACDALGLTPIGLRNIEAGRFPIKNNDAKGAPDGGSGEAPEGRVESIAERRAAAAARRSS